MKTLFNNKWSLVLVPVISVFSFVTILTAAPATVSSDLYPKTIQAAMGDLYPKAIQLPAAVSPEEVKSTPTPETTETVKASTPVPAKTTTTAAPKQVKSQPSRSTTVTPPPAPTQTSKAGAIIATGKQYIGIKYVYGGTTPSGFDCSGFTKYVFGKNGINLPRISRDQYNVGTSISFNNLKPGDLIFFSFAKNGVVDHVGIFIGNGQFINASSSKGVTIYQLGTYWKGVYVGAKRVL